MTFTVIARDPADGSLGLCSATGAIAVGSRCSHISASAVVTTQHHTDWKVGPAAIELVESGAEPEAAMAALRDRDEHFAYRQIGIIDHAGRVAIHEGIDGTALAGDGYALLGNGIVNSGVIDAMDAAWNAHGSEIRFEERLLRTIEAGMSVGGDAGGHLSAILLTAPAGRSQPRTNLRVDRSHVLPHAGGNAVLELRSIYNDYAPLTAYYDAYWPANPTVTPSQYLQTRRAS